jgi:tRNA dimethylallyltransferase
MRPVLIAGPTASGKSALALRLAERDGGIVINADALQVYACWRVLTARPEAADLARAPHRLYGHVSCAAPYSVGAWLRDLAPVLDDCRARGLRPIVVGGTGLYLDALLHGLAEIPPIPPELRRRSEAILAAGGLDPMLDDLAAKDPETLAVLDRRNPMRVQRAWEVLAATGRGLLDWRRGATTPLLPEASRHVLDIDVARLDNIISLRFDRMLEFGALDETADFLAAGLSLDAPSGRALGAREIARHLAGEITLAEARDAAVLATRRYAKRQRTWFRNRFRDWARLDPADPGALDRIPR